MDLLAKQTVWVVVHAQWMPPRSCCFRFLASILFRTVLPWRKALDLLFSARRTRWGLFLPALPVPLSAEGVLLPACKERAISASAQYFYIVLVVGTVMIIVLLLLFWVVVIYLSYHDFMFPWHASHEKWQKLTAEWSTSWTVSTEIEVTIARWSRRVSKEISQTAFAATSLWLEGNERGNKEKKGRGERERKNKYGVSDIKWKREQEMEWEI